MIQQVSLNHGGIYNFMMHRAKIDSLKESCPSLRNYLREAFSCCPQDPFMVGPRSSSLKFNVDMEPVKVENHPMSTMVKAALEWKRYPTAHENVEGFLLNFDPKTIAVEIPVWLEEDERRISDKLMFVKPGPLSGHIDILRFEDGKIWVWDYKPRAHLEKFAATQLFFYSLMLSHRTKIPLENFMCGYFDDKTCFVFSPAL